MLSVASPIMKALRVLFRLGLLVGLGTEIPGLPTTAQTTSPKESQPTAPGLRKFAGVAPPAPKPNIVIILADDLGYGDLGCYGHPRFKTPNLDRMAAEGVRMTQLNTPMPFCAPTRAALLTGRYPFRCGLTTNPDPESGPVSDAVALPPGEVTLAQVLHGAGYATGMVGKWHLGHKKPEYLPTRRGFDEYFGIPYSNDMRPVRLLDGETEVEYPVVQATLTRRYTERALRFIERNRDRPFFLYFAHAMPHKPLACSEAFYKKSGAGLYGDALAELDWSVGRVLARLKDLGLDERTLVVFTSDNGPWYGGSTGGLRGMKGDDLGGRVPGAVHRPLAGRLPAGNVCRELAVTMDLFATALAAAGVPPPPDRVIDGQDLLPLARPEARIPATTSSSATRGRGWRRCATAAGSCTCCRPAIAATTLRAGAGSTPERRTA